jgi:aminoglycoside 6-adenylyltransferase
MNPPEQSEDFLESLKDWAGQKSSVRAALLTGSRANPRRMTDVLSDYDVILVVSDVYPYIEEREWIEDFGRVLVTYWDPVHPDPDFGFEQVGNVIQYSSGLKIDFTVIPTRLIHSIGRTGKLPDEMEAGYRVVLDKDNLTDALPAPGHKAFIPERPTEKTYLKVVEDFLSDAPYVAKCLWRDELMPAKWCLDCDMKPIFLRQMLEWYVQIGNEWSQPVGVLGRGLKELLPLKVWSELESTYAGADIEANWDALLHTMDLFRKVAIEVGEHLGYSYPLDMDGGVRDYVIKIRKLE